MVHETCKLHSSDLGILDHSLLLALLLLAVRLFLILSSLVRSHLGHALLLSFPILALSFHSNVIVLVGLLGKSLGAQLLSRLVELITHVS